MRWAMLETWTRCNASVLDPSPQPQLADYPLEVLEPVYPVNTLAPLALFQMLLPQLGRRGGRVINVGTPPFSCPTDPK